MPTLHQRNNDHDEKPDDITAADLNKLQIADMSIDMSLPLAGHEHSQQYRCSVYACHDGQYRIHILNKQYQAINARGEHLNDAVLDAMRQAFNKYQKEIIPHIFELAMSAAIIRSPYTYVDAVVVWIHRLRSEINTDNMPEGPLTIGGYHATLAIENVRLVKKDALKILESQIHPSLLLSDDALLAEISRRGLQIKDKSLT